MDLTPEVMEQILKDSVPFVYNTGLKAVSMERCKVKLLMPFEGNGNHVGYMYAGALFTLAEVPGGALFFTTWDPEKFYPIVKSLNMNFLRPAKGDATIEISITEEEARRIAEEAEATGKSEFVLKGEIVDSEGNVAATSEGIYQIRSHGT